MQGGAGEMWQGEGSWPGKGRRVGGRPASRDARWPEVGPELGSTQSQPSKTTPICPKPPKFVKNN